jgi:hypothetical protein
VCPELGSFRRDCSLILLGRGVSGLRAPRALWIGKDLSLPAEKVSAECCLS